MNRGTIVAVLIVIAGIAAGAWAIFARHNQMQHVLEAFTPPTAAMIANAPEVELLQLCPTQPPPPITPNSSESADKVYCVAQSKRVESANGFTYLRTALLNDASYEWDKPVEGAQHDWQYHAGFRRRAIALSICLRFHGPLHHEARRGQNGFDPPDRHRRRSILPRTASAGSHRSEVRKAQTSSRR